MVTCGRRLRDTESLGSTGSTGDRCLEPEREQFELGRGELVERLQQRKLLVWQYRLWRLQHGGAQIRRFVVVGLRGSPTGCRSFLLTIVLFEHVLGDRPKEGPEARHTSIHADCTMRLKKRLLHEILALTVPDLRSEESDQPGAVSSNEQVCGTCIARTPSRSELDVDGMFVLHI